jgi:hypothetical protein
VDLPTLGRPTMPMDKLTGAKSRALQTPPRTAAGAHP